MAKELATRTALKIVVLERGGPAQNPGLLRQHGRAGLCRPPAHDAADSRRDRHLPPLARATALCPSGSTVRFCPAPAWAARASTGAASPTAITRTISAASRTSSKSTAAQRLPEDCDVRDWPITYDELEPDYERAERMMGISGKAGNLHGNKIEGGNIFEGPRASEYPTPPMKMPASRGAVPRRRALARLSSVSFARRHHQRGLHQSRRRRPRRLLLLRLLRAVRVHDRRQSPAHQHADAGARASKAISSCAPAPGCGGHRGEDGRVRGVRYMDSQRRGDSFSPPTSSFWRPGR